MEKLKQISVKIDAGTISKIDEMAHKASYWKRNTIINKILIVMMNYASKDNLFDIMRYHPRDFKGIEITVKLVR